MEHDVNYHRPITVDDGIFWVGVYEPEANLHCNSYLVTAGEKALVIDGGSRPDFAAIMMKILQAGVHPKNIVGLIYQHYDPDLCGSISNFIDLCGNPDLKIYSKASNNLFLRYYFEKTHHHMLVDIDRIDFRLTVEGRVLRFIKTPYTHSAGSFVTLDERTETLFTGDLFGSFATNWQLFHELDEECFSCPDYQACPNRRPYCPIPDFLSFHKHVMPCNKALQHSMEVLEQVSVKTIAPQHGSIFHKKRDIRHVISLLKNLTGVGIDAIA
jgi:flavorubredoxin